MSTALRRHSEPPRQRGEESLGAQDVTTHSVFLHLVLREILRFAQNDSLWAVLLLLIGPVAMSTGCGRDGSAPLPHPPPKDLRIFHAAGMAPVLDAVRDDCLSELGIRLQTEGAGSQTSCYKLSQLGRSCDLIMLADSALVAELLEGWCSWRIDFANDAVVIGIGARAPHVSDAETDWPAVLTRNDVRLGRVNENLGPIGYRTLLVWKLQELRGSKGLHDTLKARCEKVVDHVTRLTPLLKIGDIDYAFVYRSICVAHDIRTIELPPEVNLGAVEADYSKAVVAYKKPGRDGARTIEVKGAPITWTLSIPDRDADAETARAFVRWLLTKRRDVLERNGFRPIASPRFAGPEDAWGAWQGVCTRTGPLK